MHKEEVGGDKKLNERKKIAVYARVSTNKQDADNQTRILKEEIQGRGWEGHLYVEQESTRKTRPIKNDLMNRLRKGEYDGLMIWALDRWARSVSELVRDFEELHKKGIELYVLKEGIDLSSPAGQLQFHLLSALAQFERSMISERTKAGLQRTRAEGKKLGRPKGSKDKKARKRTGYRDRWFKERSKQTGSVKIPFPEHEKNVFPTQ